MKNTLILIRGLPGAGKSTIAAAFPGAMRVEADDFFRTGLRGAYEFDASKLHRAHAVCFMRAKVALLAGQDVVVSNTSTTEKEVATYQSLAQEMGAMFVSLIVENRHGNKSVHDVPDATMDKMRKRFSIKL